MQPQICWLLMLSTTSHSRSAITNFAAGNALPLLQSKRDVNDGHKLLPVCWLHCICGRGAPAKPLLALSSV